MCMCIAGYVYIDMYVGVYMRIYAYIYKYRDIRRYRYGKKEKDRDS